MSDFFTEKEEEAQEASAEKEEEPQEASVGEEEEAQETSAEKEEEPQEASAKEEEEPQEAFAKEEEEPQEASAKEEEEPQEASAEKKEEPQEVSAKEQEEPQEASVGEEEEPQEASAKEEEEPQEVSAKEEEEPQEASVKEQEEPQEASAEKEAQEASAEKEEETQEASVGEEEEPQETSAEKKEEPQKAFAKEQEEPQEASAEKEEETQEASAKEQEEPQEASAEKKEEPQEASAKEQEEPQEASAKEEEEPQEASAEKEAQEASEEKEKKTRKAFAEMSRKVLAFLWKARKIACCLAVVAAVTGCVAYWFYCQPRFHDLTVELGTENISIEDFMTEFANTRNAGIVTDLSTVNIGSVGSFSLTLRSGSKDETVTLTVEDTTPPRAQFISRLEKTPDYKPDPYDFVSYYSDMSEVTVRFVGNVVIPLNYEDQSFTVVVEDACGNAVSKECTLSIVWLKSEYTMELGELLKKEDLLFNPERDSYTLGQGDIDVVNASGTGEYQIASLVDESVCQIHVVDTTPPELVLTDISVFQGEEITVDSFVESCFDAAGDVQVRLLTEPDVNTLGVQTMTIEATDINGNTTTATAALAVVKDKTPPVIRGLSTLSVEKRSNPDYLAGVSAMDKVDGACEVTYDSRGVDLAAAGTYYVTYTSKDKDGNTARVKRTVVVKHDQEDTDALADSIAAGLGSDPEAIRDYVRNTIKYSHNSGGEDPVWYGFTNNSGDCLVHACCLQSLLTRKGYETQLIWVTDQSHYWLIIHLDGVWRHIDATPGVRHTKYSLMTDEQRYSILQGRDWDRSAWPACE